MKILFVIFVSAVCVNGSSANQKILNPIPVLRQLFEILRSGIKNGSPANNLPIMDPFKIETGEIDVQDKFVRLDANLTDLIIRGLGEFRVKDVQFSQDQIAVDVKLLFPKLYFESDLKFNDTGIRSTPSYISWVITEFLPPKKLKKLKIKITELTFENFANSYQMKGSFVGLPLFGEGRLRFEVITLEIKCRLYLTPSANGKSALIEKFENAQFTLGQVLSRTELDGNFDCIFNNIVEDVMAMYLNRFNKYIVQTFGEVVMKNTNTFLEKFDTWRIIMSLL